MKRKGGFMEDDVSGVKEFVPAGLETDVCVLGKGIAHKNAWLGFGLKFVMIIRLSQGKTQTPELF